MRITRIKSLAHKDNMLEHDEVQIGDYVVFTKLHINKRNLVINKKYEITYVREKEEYSRRCRWWILNDKSKRDGVRQNNSNEFYFIRKWKN